MKKPGELQRYKEPLTFGDDGHLVIETLYGKVLIIDPLELTNPVAEIKAGRLP